MRWKKSNPRLKRPCNPNRYGLDARSFLYKKALWSCIFVLQAQKKALAKASAFFNEAHLAVHEASCKATHEAGLRPMKRACGTWRELCALRFMFAKQTHHASVASALYR